MSKYFEGDISTATENLHHLKYIRPILELHWVNNSVLDKKYVTQAFDLRLKGRNDVLLAYYGENLFNLPAIIVVAQVKDELGVSITEHSIYTLKKRIKKKQGKSAIALPADLPAS